jgi:flagellar biosynthesis GTPase FlhF
MASGSADAAAEARKSAAPKRSFASRVFGYDMFISLALRETERSNWQITFGVRPRSTRTYASDLARRLQDRDITVFFSEYEAAPGEQLDITLINALHRSRTLVVIANRGTLEEPRWVRQEVEEFRRRHPNRPIVRIVPPSAVAAMEADPALKEQTQKWLPDFEKKIWVEEADEAFEKGEATDTAVERLELTPAGIRANVKWRWLVYAVFTLLIGLLGAAIMLGSFEREERRIAEANAERARENAEAAQKNERRALDQKTRADDNARKAQQNADEANRQKEAALRNARESKARELAARATESLSDDPELSILLSVQAVDATMRFGESPVAGAEDVLHKAILSSRWRLILGGHGGHVLSVAWSPDGKRLATGSVDKTAKVWDAARGQELLTLRCHAGPVTSVAWSSDSKWLASASDDGTVQIYAMDIHDLLKLASSRVTRDLTPDECKSYFQSEKCPAMP